MPGSCTRSCGSGSSDDRAHLRDRELRGGRHHGPEIHLRVAEDEIAGAVGGVGAHQREVAGDRLLEHVVALAEAAHLLALGQLGAEADRRVERRDAGAARADALGERALRHHLELDLAGHPARLERRGLLVVPARRRADHLAHRSVGDQLMGQRIAVRRRVDHQREVFRSAFAQSANELVGKARAAEARDEDRRAVRRRLRAPRRDSTRLSIGIPSPRFCDFLTSPTIRSAMSKARRCHETCALSRAD